VTGYAETAANTASPPPRGSTVAPKSGTVNPNNETGGASKKVPVVTPLPGAAGAELKMLRPRAPHTQPERYLCQEDSSAPALPPAEPRLLVMVSAEPAPSPVVVSEMPADAPGYARASALEYDETTGWKWTQATISTECAGPEHSLVTWDSNGFHRYEPYENEEGTTDEEETGVEAIDAVPDVGDELCLDDSESADVIEG
jgi:hypothetical protein